MKPSKLLCLSTLITVSLLLSDANVSSSKERPNQHQKSSAETQGTIQQQPELTVPLSIHEATEAALLEAVRTIHSQEEAAGKQEQRQYEPLNAPSNLISIGLLIVGAFYSLFTWKQLAAIKEEAQIARQSMTIAQRAYIYVSGIRLKRLDDENVQITYPLYNGGQTPATLTGRFIRVIPYERVPDENPTGDQVTQKESVVIPPSKGIESDAINPPYFLTLTKEETDKIADRSLSLLLYGFLFYRDIFGLWHKTGVGAVYSGPLEIGKTYFMGFVTKSGYNYFD